MKRELYGLSENKNSNDRREILELCSDFSNLCLELEKFKYNVKNDINILLKNTFVSGAGMIKIKIVDGFHGAMLLHIFGNENTSRQIPENKHIHDFQAISYVCSGEINEKMFSFNKSNESTESIYKDYILIMNSLSVEKRNKILYELEKASLNLFYKPNKTLIHLSEKLGISIYNLSIIHTVFDSNKEKNDAGKVYREKFYTKGVFDIKYEGSRKISEGEKYFLSAENGHQIKTSYNTTTIFLVDKTYRTKGFPKDINSNINRGHCKRLPNMQDEYEKREYGSYNISSDYLLNLVNSEINKILLKIQ